MICKNCGNKDAYEKRGKWEDGIYQETCDQCRTFETPSMYRDETEKLLGQNLPKKFAFNAIQRHRAEKAEALRRNPNVRGKPTL